MRFQFLFICVVSLVGFSCSESKNKKLNMEVENQNLIRNENTKVEQIAKCGDDLQQQALVNNCTVCHTDLGLDEVPTIRKDLSEFGFKLLRNKVDSLHRIKDRQHFNLLDSLTTNERDCIVNYLMRYKKVQP